jgi:hypothetical protein
MLRDVDRFDAAVPVLRRRLDPFLHPRLVRGAGRRHRANAAQRPAGRDRLGPGIGFGLAAQELFAPERMGPLAPLPALGDMLAFMLVRDPLRRPQVATCRARPPARSTTRAPRCPPSAGGRASERANPCFSPIARGGSDSKPQPRGAQLGFRTTARQGRKRPQRAVRVCMDRCRT